MITNNHQRQPLQKHINLQQLYDYQDSPEVKNSQLIIDKVNSLQSPIYHHNLSLVNQHLITHFSGVKYKQYTEQIDKALSRSAENMRRYNPMNDDMPSNPLKKLRNRSRSNTQSNTQASQISDNERGVESKLRQGNASASLNENEYYKFQCQELHKENEILKAENQKLKQLLNNKGLNTSRVTQLEKEKHTLEQILKQTLLEKEKYKYQISLYTDSQLEYSDQSVYIEQRTEESILNTSQITQQIPENYKKQPMNSRNSLQVRDANRSMNASDQITQSINYSNLEFQQPQSYIQTQIENQLRKMKNKENH